MAQEYSQVNGGQSESGGSSKKPLYIAGGGCCCCAVLLVVLYYAVVHFFTGKAYEGFVKIDEKEVVLFCKGDLDMSNVTNNIRWPGCGIMSSFSDFEKCKGTCVKKAEMLAMDEFNTKMGGKLVSYKSRRGGAGHDGEELEVVELTGWLLPAADKKAPRIVLQHGFTSNSNKFRQMYAAYLLRKLGFNVLVNNLRDHCYSEKSEAHVVEWGHAYPYDLLGAWDYMKHDMDNHLGGTVDDSKVGIMGFSMGAFISATTFGLEGRIPAAWVDAPPLNPKEALRKGAYEDMKGMLSGLQYLLPVIIDGTWANVDAAAKENGVDLMKYLPEKTLPFGPDTKRPFFWSANRDDDTVDFNNGEMLVELVKTLPEKYELHTFRTEGDCNGHTHCTDHLRIPAQYSANLCHFWRKVFGMKTDGCGSASDGTDDVATGRRLVV